MKLLIRLILVLTSLALNANVASAKTHTVTVQDNSFSPITVVIEAGDTVRWINEGFNAHNIYAQGKFRCANGCEADGGNGDASNSAWIAEVTFRTPETIQYECEPHAIFGMFGSVVVQTPSTGNLYQIDAKVDNTFEPNDLTVMAGDVVYFTNQGGVHNFRTADDNLICTDICQGDGFTGSTNPTGLDWKFYARFNEFGEIPFYCANPAHSNQVGILRVLSDVIYSNGFEQP